MPSEEKRREEEARDCSDSRVPSQGTVGSSNLLESKYRVQFRYWNRNENSNSVWARSHLGTGGGIRGDIPLIPPTKRSPSGITF